MTRKRRSVNVSRVESRKPRLQRAHVVSRFFFVVVTPGRGVCSKDPQEEILTGELFALNALEATNVIEKVHPDAIEIQVRKQKDKVQA